MNSILITTILVLTVNAAYYKVKIPDQETSHVDPKTRISRNLGYSSMSTTGNTCYGCVNNSSMTKACVYRPGNTGYYYCCSTNETYYKCLNSNSLCSNEYTDDRKYLGCAPNLYGAGYSSTAKLITRTYDKSYTTWGYIDAGQVGHARLKNNKST